MSSIYYKALLCPLWVTVDLKGSKLTKVTNFLQEAGAYHQPWPSASYYDHLQTYRNKGWAFDFIPKHNLNPLLLQQSCLSFVQQFFSVKSQISLPLTVHRMNRVIDTPEQGTTFFDAMLEIQDATQLSQMFGIGDLCHTLNKNYKVFYTVGHYNKKALQKMATKHIVVSNSPDADINLTDVKPADVESTLVDYFQKFPV